jgi:hypothetical protein
MAELVALITKVEDEELKLKDEEIIKLKESMKWPKWMSWLFNV